MIASIVILTIVWFTVGCFWVEYYLDTFPEITKKYKCMILTAIIGPVVWLGWCLFLVFMAFEKFGKWLRT